MTRARDRLIMIGTTKSLDKIAEDKTGLTSSSILGAKHSLDWVLKTLYAGSCKEALSKIVPCGTGTRCTELLQVFRHPSVTGPAAAASLAPQDLEEWAEEAKASDISFFEERFAFRYPHGDAVRVPGKTSVSSLSHSDVVITEKPAFAGGASMTAADKGTAAHLLMQRIVIRAHTKKTVEAEVERLQKAGFMTREQANAVNINSVTAFFGSPLGKRLASSKRVEREWEFNHAKPALELLPDTDSAEPVLLQGIIDCAFLEDGEWVLIDYKTDFVPDGVTPEQAAAKHSLQISLYRKALADLTGLPVKEAYIHLLSIGESVRME
jgi:ATP-dependent helicase/nuclease subunit A